MLEALDSDVVAGIAGRARNIARVAAMSVVELCDSENGRFWRNTSNRDASAESDLSSERFPTVSLACSIALLQSQRLAGLCDGDDAAQAALGVARQVANEYGLADLESSTLADRGGLSSFTVALYLQCLAEFAMIDQPSARARYDEILPQLLAHPSAPLAVSEGGELTHPFVIYHLLRAAKSCEKQFGSSTAMETLVSGSRHALVEAARRVIASHVLGSASPDEYVALAFCGCGLAGARSSVDNGLALSSLLIAISSQDASGCWALGRIVEDNKGLDRAERVEISTYEIAWAIAAAARRLLQGGAASRDGDFLNIVSSLDLALLFAQKNLSSASSNSGSILGWCSDHPYGKPLVESWTSATVLHSAVELQRLLAAWDSARTLSRFIFTKPSDRDWPKWLRWPQYVVSGEVDHAHPILSYLDKHIVQPITSSPKRLPDPHLGSVSALLFGPPGTSKTTIVKGVADGLGWPLVSLSPGLFIERGLELIEAQAREVFDDLHKLRRCVVLFDECDELFRERTPDGSTEQVRSITAFVTASMLPKLQDLHDRGQVVFIICTNNFGSLDSAVKRRGRIDHILGVGPPDPEARVRIVSEYLPVGGSEWPGVDNLAARSERFTRGEIAYLVRRFAHLRTGDPGKDEALVSDLVADMQSSLNISIDALKAFSAQAATSSAAHMPKRG